MSEINCLDVWNQRNDLDTNYSYSFPFFSTIDPMDDENPAGYMTLAVIFEIHTYTNPSKRQTTIHLPTRFLCFQVSTCIQYNKTI